jgi:hypothetical protein
MKNLLKLLLVSFMSFTGCSKDVTIKPKDYPFLLTQEADVTEYGATFYGEIVDAGNLEIKRFGFIWEKISGQGLTLYSRELIATENPEPGYYSITITSGLTLDQQYNIKSFAETDSYSVFGNTVTFTGKGCTEPKVNEFSPSSGPTGTIVELTGSNFSPYIADNYVSIGVKTLIVQEAYEDRLILKIPMVTSAITGPISVLTSGMTVTTQQSFEIIYP